MRLAHKTVQLGNIKKLFTEDRAVSPVIGVILMVAITGILAAVIGTFVLGLGDDLQDTSPTASIDFDSDQSGTDNATVTIAHTVGDTIETGDTVNVTATGTSELGSDLPNNVQIIDDEEEWSAGQSFTLDIGDDFGSADGDNWDDNTVRVNWQSADGQNSATIGSSTSP